MTKPLTLLLILVLLANLFSPSYTFSFSSLRGGKSRNKGKKSYKNKSKERSDNNSECHRFYEWTIETDTVINGEQYYGFVLNEASIGTFTLPVYDNIALGGDPVARLRGNMIVDPVGTFTADASLYFYEDDSYVGVHVSYTYDPNLQDDFVYGFTTGGTGIFTGYNAYVTSVVVSEDPKFTVEWTFCTDDE